MFALKTWAKWLILEIYAEKVVPRVFLSRSANAALKLLSGLHHVKRVSGHVTRRTITWFTIDNHTIIFSLRFAVSIAPFLHYATVFKDHTFCTVPESISTSFRHTNFVQKCCDFLANLDRKWADATGRHHTFDKQCQFWMFISQMTCFATVLQVLVYIISK